MVVMKFQTQQDYFGYVKMENKKKYLILLIFIFIIPFVNAPTQLFFEDWEAQNYNQWTNEANGWAITDTRAKGDTGYSSFCYEWLTCDKYSNAVDTSSASSVNVSFWFNDDDMDAGNDINWYWNDTDGNWDDMGDIDAETLGCGDDTWCEFSLVSADSQYKHTGFSVRFYGTLGNNENYWLDNINISYTEAVEDSCTYTSGTWEIDLSDNCVIDDLQDASGNAVIVSGSSGSLIIASGGEIRCNDFLFTPSDFNGDAIFNIQIGGKLSCGM